MIAIFGIIGAMDREVELFIKNISEPEIMNRASMTFYKGVLKGQKVVVVKSGVGKVNAAICTQILIDYYKPDAVFCTGIAGSLREDLYVGDTVISEDVVQYDVDGTVFGHELGEIPNLGVKNFMASSELIERAVNAHKKLFKDKKVIAGRILTGDQFISSKEKADYLKNVFNGDCVEMEGGAVGQTCFLNKTPFLIIRSISDNADGKAKIDYDVFADETAKKSYKLITGILESLKNN